TAPLRGPEPPPRDADPIHRGPAVPAERPRSGTAPWPASPDAPRPPAADALGRLMTPTRPPEAPRPEEPRLPPPAKPQPSPTHRFTAWRDRVRPPGEDATTASWSEALPTWRDELVTWMRAVAAGQGDRPAPRAPAVDAMAARLGVPELQAVIALGYASHLAG